MGFMMKAIMGFVMPALTTSIMSALSSVGIMGAMTVETLVTSLLTGLVVFMVPNKKAA